MALKIFCISGVPRLRDNTQRARKIAKISARALAPITTYIRKDCVCVMLRGRWECLRRTPRRSGDHRGGRWAPDSGAALDLQGMEKAKVASSANVGGVSWGNLQKLGGRDDCR